MYKHIYIYRWHRMGQAKVAVKVDNDESLEKLAFLAQEAGLITYLVEDAGTFIYIL
jgi:peptidyl-tRNA hydrolase